LVPLSPSCSDVGEGRKAHSNARTNHANAPHRTIRIIFQGRIIVEDIVLSLQ
jgi:hypothetical protein